ncbi:MAG: GntP family permease [Candidatus Hydrogenedentes bacterium]|nr:GntP family permease [Candidatus Hydrogenedentota bacterium]
MLSMAGLIGGLALLIALTIRGMNILLAAPLCGVAVALASGIPLLLPAAEGGNSFLAGYMAGFAGFLRDWFPVFLLGAMFGKVMEDSGAADSVASAIVRKLGIRHAALGVVLACAVLTYGGISVFVVAFSVYPMAVSLFKQADLPRRFIPAALAFGSGTFTMTSAGSMEIQNFLPMKYLGTTHYAGWQVSLPVALFMACAGMWWFTKMLKRARDRGERFEDRGDATGPRHRNLPHPLLGAFPLVLVLAVSFYCSVIAGIGDAALVVALLAGLIFSVAIYWRNLVDLESALSASTFGALVAISNTCAVVGFGSIARLTPAFQGALAYMEAIPGNGLIGAAVAISVVVALTGSSSGGQAIALPILGPHYTAAGVDPDALHRVIAITSGGLDSLPHNGYVVTTIRAICGETHRTAYLPVAALTVVVPFTGAILAIILFLIGL